MILSKLCAAIDAMPTVYGMSTMGPIAVQKGSLKEAFKRTYQRNEETGRKLNAEGVVVLEEEPA